MAACGGNFQGPLYVFLAHDVGKVRSAHLPGTLRLPDRSRGEGCLSSQMGHQLLHIFHAVYRHALGQGGLRRVFRRHIELSDSGPGRRHGHGQHTAYGAQPSGKAQLSHKGCIRRQRRDLL